MLTPYHPNSAQARSHPSQRRNSQHINQKLSTQRQRSKNNSKIVYIFSYR